MVYKGYEREKRLSSTFVMFFIPANLSPLQSNSRKAKGWLDCSESLEIAPGFRPAALFSFLQDFYSKPGDANHSQDRRDLLKSGLISSFPYYFYSWGKSLLGSIPQRRTHSPLHQVRKSNRKESAMPARQWQVDGQVVPSKLVRISSRAISLGIEKSACSLALLRPRAFLNRLDS